MAVSLSIPEKEELRVAFRDLLKDLADNLLATDLDDLKHCMKGKAGWGKGILEKITTPHEFFSHLENVGDLSDAKTSNLKDLLERIYRKDLVEKVDHFEKTHDAAADVKSPTNEDATVERHSDTAAKEIRRGSGAVMRDISAVSRIGEVTVNVTNEDGVKNTQGVVVNTISQSPLKKTSEGTMNKINDVTMNKISDVTLNKTSDVTLNKTSDVTLNKTTESTVNQTSSSYCSCYTSRLSIIQEELGSWYRGTMSKLKPIPWAKFFEMKMEHIFTNLEIVPGYKERLSKRGDNLSMVSAPEDSTPSGGFVRDILGRILTLWNSDPRQAEIAGPETVETVEQLANKLWGEDGRRVTFIEGSPGIGKSTLCRRLAYTWAKDSYKIHGMKFKLVLLLEARVMQAHLKQCIYEQLLPIDFDLNAHEVYQCIQTYQGNCLVIVDGVDELNDKSKSDLMELLKGKLLRNSQILITGRPEVSPEYIEFCDIHLRIRGFSKENRNYYIHKYFSVDQSDCGDKLIQDIEKTSDLKQLTVNPFTILLLCILAEEGEGEIPTNQQDILKKLTAIVCKRYTSNYQDIHGEGTSPCEEELLSAARVLAFTGIQSGKLAFEESFVRESFPHDLCEHLLKSGLLNRDVTVSRLHAEGYCYFPHKTIQESLCAEYLVGRSQEVFIWCWDSVRCQSDRFLKICLLKLLGTHPHKFDIVFTNITADSDRKNEELLMEIRYQLTDVHSIHSLARYFTKRYVDIPGKFSHAWEIFSKDPNLVRVMCQKMTLPPVLLQSVVVPKLYSGLVYLPLRWDNGLRLTKSYVIRDIAMTFPVVNCLHTEDAACLLRDHVDVRVLNIVQCIVTSEDYRSVCKFIEVLKREDSPLTVYLVLVCDCQVDYWSMKLLKMITSYQYKNTKLSVQVHYWLSNPHRCDIDIPLHNSAWPITKRVICKCVDDPGNIYGLSRRTYNLKGVASPHRMYFDKHCSY